MTTPPSFRSLAEALTTLRDTLDAADGLPLGDLRGVVNCASAALNHAIAEAGGRLAVEDDGRLTQADASSLLQHAPEKLGELAPWFLTLSPAQLRPVWVAAVINAIHAQAGDVSCAELSDALSAVRDHVPIKPATEVAASRPSAPPVSRQRRSKLDLVADSARSRLSSFPDVRLNDLFEEIYGRGCVGGMYLQALIRKTTDLEYFKKRTPDGRGHQRPAWFVRKKGEPSVH